jgi:site-specific recombinase XerD
MRTQNYSELRPNINVRDEEKARFSAFLNELGEQGRAAKTIGSYRSDWLGFTDWYEGCFKTPFEVNELTAETVKQYRDRLVEQGLKPATVNRKLVFLKRYTKWSTERGFLTDVNQACKAGSASAPTASRVV